jgi:hypothetical protein
MVLNFDNIYLEFFMNPNYKFQPVLGNGFFIKVNQKNQKSQYIFLNQKKVKKKSQK